MTQDVLFKVYRKVGAFRGDAALSSWIYRITFNAAMSRLRTAQYQRAQAEERREAAIDSDGDGRRRRRPATSPTGRTWRTSSVLRSQLRRRVFRAILALPAIYRAPVMLRDIQGMSTEEASAMLQREGSDAQVAPAPRPVDSAQAARRLRRRPLAAPADRRDDRARNRTVSREALQASDHRSAEAVRATEQHRVVERHAARQRSAPAARRRRCRRSRAGPAARPCACACRLVRVGRDEAAHRPARAADDRLDRLRRGRRQRVRARRPQRGNARAEPPARRFVEQRASARSRRSSRPPTGPRCDAGGTPSTVSATSRGDPFASSATSARAAAASASGADPNSRARVKRSSRTPRSTSSRCAAPAHTTTARRRDLRQPLQQQPARPRPAIRRRPTRRR